MTQCQHTQHMHNADRHWCEVCLIKQPFTKPHKDQMVETRYVGMVQKYCIVLFLSIILQANTLQCEHASRQKKKKTGHQHSEINHRVLQAWATSDLNVTLSYIRQPGNHPPIHLHKPSLAIYILHSWYKICQPLTHRMSYNYRGFWGHFCMDWFPVTADLLFPSRIC